MTHALDERSQTILLELIRDHIEKAEPVGSRSLSKNHFKKLSPCHNKKRNVGSRRDGLLAPTS